MLHDFLQNFEHNLFKPLLLFFYFGFLLPLLKVDFEFPYVIYQGLTMYLLLAIGWHGGEELAAIKASSIGDIAGFMVIGFVLNFVIGLLAYLLLSWLTGLRQVDKATVAGYYGSDSAGTFATCVAILVSVGMAFDAYMPVMLAVMEVPGCLVALYLVARLRQKGMDADGNMPGEPGYTAPAPMKSGPAPRPSHLPDSTSTPKTTAESPGSWISRWTSGDGPSPTTPTRPARSRPCSPANCCAKSSSTPGCFCSSAASPSASSAGYKGTRSPTITTPSSSPPSKARCACSYSKWA